MLRNAKELEGHALHARDGNIGAVQDFFFDDREWTIRYLVVDTGTWLDSRKVLISPVAVQRVEWAERRIAVDLTQAQIRNSPGIDTEQPVSREHEAALTKYYGWPAYWGVVGFPDVGFGVPTLPMVPILPLETEPRSGTKKTASHERSVAAEHLAAATQEVDHHLRSVRAVTGHGIDATNGRIGHVDDFLIDEGSWMIRYLVVDTRNWWPGKRVVIAPEWIREVGWDDAQVHVDLTREAIKASPAYDSTATMSDDYTTELHAHYGRPRHPKR